MSTIVALVILTGASCSSPVEQAPRETIAHQVPCAIVIRERSANPFKIVQQPNEIAPAAAPVETKAAPKYTYKTKAKKPKKKKRKARR